MLVFIRRSDEAACSAITWPDIYWDPLYGRATEASDGGQWEAAVWTDDGAQRCKIIYPYLLRPIGGTRFHDIITPYNYGGPYSAGDGGCGDMGHISPRVCVRHEE